MTKEELEKEARKYADLRIPRVEMPIRNSELVKAYLSSAEPREKRIAELEAYNKKLLQSDIDKQNKIVLLSQKVNDLQKENTELDCQKNRNKACYSCANATERCFTNEISCPCEKYKSYKDENEEPKNRDCWKSCEYANPKAELIGQHIKDVQNLTKAKEILTKILQRIPNFKANSIKDLSLLNALSEAEQFINNECCPDCFCVDCTKEDCGIKKLGLVEVEK